jgi:16S rRNA (guanine527-N7)-methyltransferase
MKETISFQNVSRETLIQARDLYGSYYDEFETYLDELLWWNRKVNLVSRDVSRETLREHLVHSLIPSSMGLLNGIQDWVDAGTGGGLPGIPLAIAEPDKRWVLNDVVNKKVAAVKQMVHKLSLVNASGEAEAIENIRLKKPTGIITKHAFSAGGLISMIAGKPWKKLIMLKGADDASREIEQLEEVTVSSMYRFDFGDTEPFYEGKGILVIENRVG